MNVPDDVPCDEVLLYRSLTTCRRSTKVWWSSLTPPATVDVFGETLVLVERTTIGRSDEDPTVTRVDFAADRDGIERRRREWHVRRAS